jgi:hypothetical protein
MIAEEFGEGFKEKIITLGADSLLLSNGKENHLIT